MYGKLECSIITIMKTILEKIDKNQNNTDIIREAGRILKEGGLVAFPTETVYGLGADALNEDAAKKIYAAKGRPSDNPDHSYHEYESTGKNCFRSPGKGCKGC